GDANACAFDLALWACDPTPNGCGSVLEIASKLPPGARGGSKLPARREGSRTANGLSMLVHQAAVAFEHWTGTAAPLDVMVAAIA
ncbi:MAG TPA: hypothetical protein PKB00_10775, partial [Microthrixaceae bacterium]|nr:hypothetical protein [Microthrixaceae bacterium]